MNIDVSALDFILFVLASIGLGHILVEGTILLPLKGKLGEWSKSKNVFGWLCAKALEVMACYQCSGVYSGLAIIIMLALARNFQCLYWLEFILYGFAGSFLCTWAAIMLMYFNVSAVNNSK